ncbi:MAG TPA: DUF1207 domain-containing protein [Spirochaetota bacterium]|nr:DUF1207 domain-containing protein [Spirochaetota bacterium]HOD14473.1 DUF1207 domain-containing protein [Spirochaetota bacterium]HPG52481.1 DUF1207 domain-containing protein [Spirochaetota bacterium]HPN13461.1 DUF1207 domain-containing protein [Spirochaetota bacterium]HQL81059.1 DUF1207 domain-containing protein [Spirochaetota bacterium]
MKQAGRLATRAVLSGFALALAAFASAAPARAANLPSGDQAHLSHDSAGWLPATRLFPSFSADPRRVGFSGGIRYHDDAFNRFRTRYGTDSRVLGDDKTFGAVSLGSRLPLYRWDVARGLLQLDVEGSVWAVFAFKRTGGWLGDGSTLLNADYWFAFPTSYRYGPLALQVRFWHMSSHLGDEFIILYPEITRRNVSNEGVDLFASYDIVEQVRVHAGVGCVYHSFKGARFDPFYVEYGAELRPFNAVRAGRSLLFQPFLAAHLKNWQNNRFAISGNYALGVEFTALRGQYRPRLQLYFSFHHGPSQEGQFYHAKTTYYSLTLSFELI